MSASALRFPHEPIFIYFIHPTLSLFYLIAPSPPLPFLPLLLSHVSDSPFLPYLSPSSFFLFFFSPSLPNFFIILVLRSKAPGSSHGQRKSKGKEWQGGDGAQSEAQGKGLRLKDKEWQSKNKAQGSRLWLCLYETQAKPSQAEPSQPDCTVLYLRYLSLYLYGCRYNSYPIPIHKP